MNGVDSARKTLANDRLASAFSNWHQKRAKQIVNQLFLALERGYRGLKYRYRVVCHKPGRVYHEETVCKGSDRLRIGKITRLGNALRAGNYP